MQLHYHFTIISHATTTSPVFSLERHGSYPGCLHRFADNMLLSLFSFLLLAICLAQSQSLHERIIIPSPIVQLYQIPADGVYLEGVPAFPYTQFFSSFQATGTQVTLKISLANTISNFYLDDFSIASRSDPATNIVQNPGFETGTFAPWVVSGGPGIIPFRMHSGTYTMYDGSVSPDLVSQSLTTVAGTAYSFAFWLNSFTTSDPGSLSYVLITAEDAVPAPPYNLRLTPATDHGISDTDDLTSGSNLVIQGYALPAQVVNIFINGAASAAGTATAGSGGAFGIFQFTITSPLVTGPYTITATTSLNGVDSPVSDPYTFTYVSPSAITLELATSSDSGMPGDGITTFKELTLTGVGAKSGTVVLFDGATQIGSDSSDPIYGSFSITVTVAVGAHSFTVTQNDNAGNSASLASPLVITVIADTTTTSTTTSSITEGTSSLSDTSLPPGTSTTEVSTTQVSTAQSSTSSSSSMPLVSSTTQPAISQSLASPSSTLPSDFSTTQSSIAHLSTSTSQSSFSGSSTPREVASTTSMSPSATSNSVSVYSGWNYVGCVGSLASFAEFTVAETSPLMNVQRCLDKCVGFNFVGLHDE